MLADRKPMLKEKEAKATYNRATCSILYVRERYRWYEISSKSGTQLNH